MLLNLDVDSDIIGTIFQTAVSQGMTIEDLLTEFCEDLAFSKWTPEYSMESSVHIENWLKSKQKSSLNENFICRLCETNKFDIAEKHIKKLSHIVYDLSIFGKVDGYPHNIEDARSAIKKTDRRMGRKSKTGRDP